MSPPYPISPKLSHATDTLLLQAVDALEAAGADFEGQGSSKHALMIPGQQLLRVNEALAEWNLISCTEGSCDSWTDPVAQVAQQVFQAIDTLFEQTRHCPETSKEARIPFLASAPQLRILADLARQWAQTPRPRSRRSFR